MRKRKGGKAKQKKTVYLPEYYQLAFAHLHAKYLKNTGEQVSMGRSALRKKYADSVATGRIQVLEGDDASTFMSRFLSVVEGEMKELLASHSPYYWLYLYRRVGLGSILEGGENDNAMTLGSIRKVVETAMLKHGDLSNQTDLCSSRAVPAKDLLDGLFYEALASSGQKATEIEAVWRLYNRKEQWVPSGYKRADHAKIYMLEGYAYEFWRATAAMRAIGKGAALHVAADGAWNELRSDALDWLIRSFDRRLEAGQRYISTAKGLLSFNRPSAQDDDQEATAAALVDKLIFASYNVKHIKIGEISAELREIGDAVTNFFPVSLDYTRFIQAHRILEKPFHRKWGFTLRGVFLFFWSVSLFVLNARRTEDAPNSLSVFHLLQRAYALVSYDLVALSSELMTVQETFPRPGGLDTQVSATEMEAICRHFTLSAEGQDRISLWSYGPRPIMIPYGNGLVIDIGGMEGILTNLFFGVREKQEDRGTELEEILREETLHRGFDLLEDRKLRFDDGDYREADLVIRVGDVLVLCDCRSIERPLDYIVGKPSTIAYRNKLLVKKVEQVNSLKEYILAKPAGKNYDFSWARTVYSIGVLPDIEWIPSDDPSYWLDKERNLPILMSVEEMFAFLVQIKSVSTSDPGQ